jgi:hypothetical protein
VYRDSCLGRSIVVRLAGRSAYHQQITFSASKISFTSWS